MRKEEQTAKKGTIASEYEKLKLERKPYLDKALVAASYTIPSIIKSHQNRDRNTPQIIECPHQSLGADGVNNLAAKVTLVMLPPNQTFYHYNMERVSLLKEAQKRGVSPSDLEIEINQGLSLIEKVQLDYIEQSNDRVCVGEAMKHVYICGNVFLVHDPEDGLRMYPLDRYCVKRDYVGNVLVAITEETIGVSALPKSIQDFVKQKVIEKSKDCVDKTPVDEKEVTLYTKFKKTTKGYTVEQEVEGYMIPEAKGFYPKDVCPFMALRYTRIEGESYGRGLIEEYIGDISYLDTMQEAVKQASIAGAKLIPLVNPHGITKIQSIRKAKNGEFVSGRAEDITMLQANKYNDLRVAQTELDKTEKRLNRIFLMKAAIQRQAERVTAEEIRQMTQDLEEALGNHYAIMCKEFQLAYVKITFFHLKKQKGMKDILPSLWRNREIKLTVTTGLEALGRNSDLNKYNSFFEIMSKFAQSANIIGAKTEKVANIVATALNLDIKGLLYTEEEKAQAAEAQQKQDLMRTVAPNMVNKYGDMLKQQQIQEGQQEG